ncbi:MAG: hypothetical protein J5661_03550 [Bacteroidaceae bacterium]|nr:hypothetical protein [Bacteroidaceae bacterium]
MKVLALWCPCSAIAQNLVESELPPSSSRYHNLFYRVSQKAARLCQSMVILQRLSNDDGTLRH